MLPPFISLSGPALGHVRLQWLGDCSIDIKASVAAHPWWIVNLSFDASGSSSRTTSKCTGARVWWHHYNCVKPVQITTCSSLIQGLSSVEYLILLLRFRRSAPFPPRFISPHLFCVFIKDKFCYFVIDDDILYFFSAPEYPTTLVSTPIANFTCQNGSPGPICNSLHNKQMQDKLSRSPFDQGKYWLDTWSLVPRSKLRPLAF